MGNLFNRGPHCEKCYKTFGYTVGLYIYNNNNLGGHISCIDCYLDMKSNLNIYENKCKKTEKCKICKQKSGKNNISVFKIYWFGKYGGEYLCEKCVYNKKYRNMNLNN